MNIFLGFLFVLLMLRLGLSKKPTPASKVVECPPHEWTQVEQLNEDGSVMGTYLSCKKCGPMVSHSGDNDE